MFDLSFLNKKPNNKIKPVVLLVLDGFGIAPPSYGNAISEAKTPFMDAIQAKYPYGSLIAAGESVGLPANEAGNSEVGHLTIGAGRVVDQSLVRINKSVEDDSFYYNKAFLNAIKHINANNSKLHIMGLASSGSVHSSINHLYALIELCVRHKVRDVRFHLFTDGRDAPPTDGQNSIAEVDEKLKETSVGSIVTISGRYYAMDRDARWERTKRTWDAIVLGRGKTAQSAVDAMKASYQDGKTDEFVDPVIIDPSVDRTVKNGDAAIFFNFRIDRPRQLTMAFTIPNFESIKQVEFGYLPHDMKLDKEVVSGPTFQREKIPQNLYFVTMTQYQENLPVSDIAFPPFTVNNSIVEVVANKGLKHFHLAESEKERMVTFYMDGLREEPFPGETVKIVPSPNVPTYDKKPEMSVYKIVKEFNKAISKDIYSLFLMNFANPDMVAHSGNLNATIKAIEHVDKAVKSIVTSVLLRSGAVVITADHGNAEELLTFDKKSFYFTTKEGKTNTEHSNNPVPVYIISDNQQIQLSNGEVTKGIKYNINGSLADVAPTVLALMGIEKPKEMTGSNLLAGVTS